MFLAQPDCKWRESPPDYEDPPAYSDGRYLMVNRRLMALMTLVIMILLSLIVAILIKHSQLLEKINDNRNCVKLCQSQPVKYTMY